MTASDGASIDEILKSIIGQPTPTATVVVDRAPVAFFAEAVLDNRSEYKDPGAAREAGFTDIPAPPTFSFVMENWGKYREVQSGDGPNVHPMAAAIGALMANGGLILHGEEEFEYFRPVVVGDVLHGEGSIVDAYQKESKGRTMSFIVTEMRWKDESGAPVVTTKFNLIHRA